MYLKEKLNKRRINEKVREGRAGTLPGMFMYYCGPCMIVKREIKMKTNMLIETFEQNTLCNSVPSIMKSIAILV